MNRLIVFVVIVFSVSVQIAAQSATPGINKTEKNQQSRIKEGYKSGELTKQETRSLEKQQAKINHDKKIAKADGVVTKKERRHIKNEQAKASKNIYRKKHNKKVSM